MNRILSRLDIINELLIKNAFSKDKAGLLNGKLGLSIYFFTLARETQKQEYQEVLEKLIGEVYDAVDASTFPADFEEGLAGIAWGICYLTRNNFVNADLDEILSEVDDRIYKYLIENIETLPLNIKPGILGYLFYYIYRLESSTGSGEKSNEHIFRMICADLINRLGKMIEEETFQSREPVLFTVFWDLPILLMLLAEARKRNINPNKIDRILDYLSPIVNSLYPSLHSNRLYLLLGMRYILNEVPDLGWQPHADFIRQRTDPSRIIDEECKNLDIMVMDGVSGLAFIGRKLAELTGDAGLLLPEDKVMAKIEESVCWGEGEFYQEIKSNIGLCSGLSGVGMIILEFLKDRREAELT